MVLHSGVCFGPSSMHYQRRHTQHKHTHWWNCLNRICSSFSAVVYLRGRRAHAFKHRFVSLASLYEGAVPFSGFGPAMSYAFVQHT
jgi:hypothetical protein